MNEFEKIKECFEFEEGIHGKEEYFNSVVLVLMIQIDGEYHFLLQKRCENIRQGGEICFPGGRIEENDVTLEKTAIRETMEEMGIPGEKIHIIGRLKTIVAPMGVIVDAFVGITEVEIGQLCINKSEVERIITIPVSHFINDEPEKYSVQIKIHPSYTNKQTNEEIILLPSEELGLPDRYKKPWGNLKYGVMVYKTEAGLIWGITARLIHECVLKLENR